MKCKTLAATILACLAGATAMASPAAASDPGNCAPNGRTVIGYPEYQCTLWRGSVPVYEGYRTDSKIVGYLWAGGRANWFLHQCMGETAYLGQYYNHWWASTLADNGRWGYVPLTYFKGGKNNQRSAKLPLSYYTGWCGGGTTYPS